jgi:osmotically-inducible protein OsmY
MKQPIQNLLYLVTTLVGLSIITSGCTSHKHHEQRQTQQFIDDKVTAERVQAALVGQGTYDYSHVQVTSTNGAVTLTGSVQNESAKQKADALAHSIHRVKSVENHLQSTQP